MDPKPVTLTGHFVRLEPLTLAHAPDLLAALVIEPDVWRYMREEPPDTVAGMEAIVAARLAEQAAGTMVAFAQVDPTGGRAIGSTTYLNISRRDRGLEIGHTWLGRPWQRTGMNTEAKYLLLRHAFEELGAVRVQLKTDGRNLQSQAAIARIGAVREGVLRRHSLVRNGFIRDSVMFSILDDEWPGVKARLEGMMADREGLRQ